MEVINGSNGFIMNVKIDIFRPISKVLLYLKINLAENENDREYRKEILRTVFDVEKMVRGISGNSLWKSIAMSIGESMDFEFKFPLKKVC
jgi:hypothetical protein